MAPSKLSPAERAFRKREAARLRQQRCRERKRQANLKKKLEEQKKAAEMKNSNAKAASAAPSIPVLEAPPPPPRHIVEPPLPPLIQKPPVLPRSYSSSFSQTSIDLCESFPSLKSESSMMTDVSHEDVQQVLEYGTPRRSSLGSRMVSSNSVVTPDMSRNKDRCTPPSPPQLAIGGRNHQPTATDRIAPLLKSQDVELEAVHAMLALKSDSPTRKTEYNHKKVPPPPHPHQHQHQHQQQPPPHRPPLPPPSIHSSRLVSNDAYDKGFEQGYKEGLQQSAKHLSNYPPTERSPHTHHTVALYPGEDHRQQFYDRRMQQAQLLDRRMQDTHDMNHHGPGVQQQFYYYER